MKLAYERVIEHFETKDDGQITVPVRDIDRTSNFLRNNGWVWHTLDVSGSQATFYYRKESTCQPYTSQ